MKIENPKHPRIHVLPRLLVAVLCLIVFQPIVHAQPLKANYQFHGAQGQTLNMFNLNLNKTILNLNRKTFPFSSDPDLKIAFDSLIASARDKGTLKVIVGFRLPDYRADSLLAAHEQNAQRAAIKQQQAALIDSLQNFNVTNIKQFDYIPFLALGMSADALVSLKNSSEITSIQEDEMQYPLLPQSIPILGGSPFGGAMGGTFGGFSGAGRTVAILDTGVDKTHPFFNNRVVSEACYSTTSASTTSFCPGGAASSTASGSGIQCPSNVDGCSHGTHVAGIAAGGNPSIIGNGVARNANIIAVQVFSRTSDCGSNPSPCTTSFVSDTIFGLERVYALRSTYAIDAVNLSLGSGRYFNYCDTAQSAYKTIIDNLRASGIVSIVASGNNGYTDSIASPACVSTAISVGSTNDGDSFPIDFVSSFSNAALMLNLLAPGEAILSANPGGSYENSQGTSQAAPMVAGAWAVMKEKFPSDTIPQTLTRLRYSGVQVLDSRMGMVKPRIKLDTALNTSSVDPCGSTTPIISGQTVNGSLSNTDCLLLGGNRADIYTFSGTQGQGVAITEASSAFFTYLYLFDANGNIVGQNGNGGTSRIPAGSGFLTLPATGTYRILATSVEGNKFGNYTLNLATTSSAPVRSRFDFDGDGKTDLSVFRPGEGRWYISQTTGGVRSQGWGLASDKLAPADFDGDGKTDLAVFRESNNNWYIFNSLTNTATTAGWGIANDLPVPADYNGDQKADIAVYRPSEGNWYRRDSDGQIHVYQWGIAGDKPAPADFNGDGVADMTVFRPSQGKWFTINSGNASITEGTWGISGDQPVPADYSGDGRADYAVYRPSNRTWYRIHSNDNSIHIITWGIAGDIPTPGDYDGDGRSDLSVFRPSEGRWYQNTSTSGIYTQNFGLNGDKPIPNAFVY